MVRDVHGKLDVLNTTGSCGAPNFRQAKGGYAVFGMGQPSLNGFRLLLQKLQREGHKVGAAQNRGVSAFIRGTGAVGAWGSNGRSLGRAAYVLQSWPWRREGFGKVFGKPCPKTSGAIPDTPHPWLSFQECVFFCVREEPVLFLRVEGDFVAYTPRGKDSLHENLHGLRRGPRGEDLELTIRKEVMAAGPWQGPPRSDARLHVVWCPTEQRLEDPRRRQPLLGVPQWGWVLTAIPVSCRSTTSRS